MLNVSGDKIYDILSEHADDDVISYLMEEYFGDAEKLKRTMSILRMADIGEEMSSETAIARRPKGIGQFEVVETFLNIGYGLGYIAAKYEK